jgi:biopolymer transport protein TolR
MSDINMTPLIDVMLVLVVIFIITAPLLASTSSLTCPKPTRQNQPMLPKSVSVAVDAAGQAYIKRPSPSRLRQLARHACI